MTDEIECRPAIVAGTDIELQKAGEWLSRQTPDSVMGFLKKTAKNKGLDFSTDYRLVYPEPGKFRRVYSACRVTGNLESAADFAKDVRKLLASADRETIQKWLVMLSSISVPRKDGQTMARVSLEAYAVRLADYPADIAKFVLLEKPWKFFPTWEEMKGELDAAVSERRVLLDRLEKVALSSKEASEKPKETQGEREAFAEKIMARFRAGKKILNEDGQLLSN